MKKKDYMKIINTILLIIIILLIGLGSYYFYQSQKKESIRFQNNLLALQDSIKKTQNLVGEEMYEKLAFDTDIEELRLLNKTLYDEVKKLKGNVELISKMGITVSSSDTLYSKDSIIVIKESTDTIGQTLSRWDFSDSTWTISGGTIFNWKDSISQSYISNRTIKLDLITGIQEIDGQKKIFVRSDNPDIVVNSLSGAVLKKDKKKFIDQFYLGPSISLGVDYNGNPNAMLGISFGWNIFSLKTK